MKVPSGKEFRLIQIEPEDNKRYLVVEASEWINLVTDLLRHPGKIRQKTKNKLIDFLVWFAIKGFYAEAYTALKGTYTKADSEAVSQWMQARLNGVRWFATDFLPTT